MDHRSLANILAILRWVKQHEAMTGADILRSLATEMGMVLNESAVARLASQVIELAADAELVISNSQLDPEAKHGVQVTLGKVSKAFSLPQINAQCSAVVGDVPAAISNLVILLSASGVKTTPDAPQEAIDLAKEIEEFMSAFEDGALDPLVRETAKQHLQILATMLRHLTVFGIEAAMATYFELLLKMKAADASTTKDQKAAAKPIMERIGGFMEGLKKADEASKAGIGLIGHAKSAAVLFGLLPPN